MSTKSILDHHLQAFAAGDIDETMQDYTEDSVFIFPETTLKGLDSIRAAFSSSYSGLFKPGTYDYTMDRTEVVGDVAYIVWHSNHKGVDVKLATDTFVIRNGKIAVHTFAASVEQK